MKKLIIKETEFPFGKISIDQSIIIAEMNEGIVYDTDDNKQLLNFCNKEFGNMPYGYISHRTNSYTVNPTVYIETATQSNIKAIAVVSANPLNKLNAAIERQFFDAPFEVFESLEEAKNWLRQLLVS